MNTLSRENQFVITLKISIKKCLSQYSLKTFSNSFQNISFLYKSNSNIITYKGKLNRQIQDWKYILTWKRKLKIICKNNFNQ